VAAIRPWFAHASSAVPPLTALPTDPLQFAEWLVASGHADQSYSQANWQDVLSPHNCALVGIPSPMDCVIPGAICKAARRTKWHRRGEATPVPRCVLPRRQEWHLLKALITNRRAGARQSSADSARGPQGYACDTVPLRLATWCCCTAPVSVMMTLPEGQLGDAMLSPDILGVICARLQATNQRPKAGPNLATP